MAKFYLIVSFIYNPILFFWSINRLLEMYQNNEQRIEPKLVLGFFFLIIIISMFRVLIVVDLFKSSKKSDQSILDSANQELKTISLFSKVMIYGNIIIALIIITLNTLLLQNALKLYFNYDMENLLTEFVLYLSVISVFYGLTKLYFYSVFIRKIH